MRFAPGFWICSLLVCCLGGSLSLLQAAEQPKPVTIFVGPQLRDGFMDVDQGVTDSIKDMKNEIKGQKSLRLTTRQDQAQLVLEVASRGATSTSGGGAAAIPVGTITIVAPIGTIGISTLLRVGTYEKPIMFQNCGSWRYCARLVVQDIKAWLDANRATLQAQQK